ncbi:DUF3592 domain-containing protein [Burkholderia stagnalis]|uniref:DUF3592 domain-containing protein n=1 Tax=Burkholderia stagnalis TaxID=1503054 RepID=UPI0009BEEB0F|nr:DUF3592 domain-containing protein [Burkholderia stagnalis]
MKFALRCARAALLLLVSALMLLAGVCGIGNSAILLRARAWPHVPASVDQCDLTRRYGKGASTWEAHAVFRYGTGRSRQYDTTWQPAGSPVYQRHPDPEVGLEQIAAMTKTYCAATANDGLRVSPIFPGIARRNEAVESGTWSSELGFGVFALLSGSIMGAMGISMLPWIEDGKKRPASRKARPSRHRAGRSGGHR